MLIRVHPSKSRDIHHGRYLYPDSDEDARQGPDDIRRYKRQKLRCFLLPHFRDIPYDAVNYKKKHHHICKVK